MRDVDGSVMRCIMSLCHALHAAGGSTNQPQLFDMPFREVLDIIGRNNIEFVYKGKDESFGQCDKSATAITKR